MKTINLIIILAIFPVSAYSQSKCQQELIRYTENLDIDSLQIEFNLIHLIKAHEDLPYYEEIRFTSSPKNPRYFLFKKTNPEATIGFKIFDWDNIEIGTETILEIEKGEFLVGLNKHQSGNYKLILYSKNPDGSCMNVSMLKRKKAGNIDTPSIALDKNTNLKELTLLKEYNQKVKGDNLPYLKEYSYVLTKNTDYYFYWEENKNLKLNVSNSKREEQTLEMLQNEKKMSKFHCQKTGIYYFIVYAKEPVIQSPTLKLFFDEQSSKSK